MCIFECVYLLCAGATECVIFIDFQSDLIVVQERMCVWCVLLLLIEPFCLITIMIIHLYIYNNVLFSSRGVYILIFMYVFHS